MKLKSGDALEFDMKRNDDNYFYIYDKSKKRHFLVAMIHVILEEDGSLRIVVGAMGENKRIHEINGFNLTGLTFTTHPNDSKEASITVKNQR